jgi:1-acyl-sn-glycerol-3-phosphate acyltransferase
MAYFALQVRYEENVTSFLPDREDTRTAGEVFENLQVKDKIIVMISAVDKENLPDKEEFITAVTNLSQLLNDKIGTTHIKDVFYKVDENTIGQTQEFVYQYLPLFLTEADYRRFDSIMQPEAIESIMQKNYINLFSPAGMALKGFIMRDPLGLGGNTLKNLQDFQLESNYEISDGYIFSADGSTSFMFITPVFATGSTGKNERLIKVIEEEIQTFNDENQSLRIEYFGGPSVAVHNARQIKKDTVITGIIALIIIMVFISMVFKRKSAIPLIITPALFGGLFALCLIYFIKGSISAIAIGSGSVVLGIALSYSIHILSHQNHVGSIPQLIKDIAYPLTVGSFTTIGAFVGLLFTGSDLLRDFGLFAALVLIGTTLFCLVFLPHFLTRQSHVKQGKMLSFIERLNAYPFEKNKWLVGGLLILAIVCIFTARHVGFNEKMSELSYEPAHLKQAEEKLNLLFNKTEKTVLFVTVGKDMEEASSNYEKTNQKLSILKQEEKIKDYASAQRFLIPLAEQQKRLTNWNEYWTPEKKAFMRDAIAVEAEKYRFTKNAFDSFYDWFDTPFRPLAYGSDDDRIGGKMLSEWQTTTDSLTMLISQVRLSDETKDSVYQLFASEPDVVIFDRGYFTNKWVSAINDDFDLILYISSFLVFFALWISYGRIELTLITFLPMLISWIIIVGIMGLFGIQFNIINIILSTFIFGIGDDFSIFIMDGLQSKYRTGQRVLNSHKTAIFCAAFTMIVGMGVLVFAQHPALQSISVISILGMVVVVLVAYTIQPVFFYLLITNPTQKGLPPYTLIGIIRSLIMYTFFMLGCLFTGILIFLLLFAPIRKPQKQYIVSLYLNRVCRFILRITLFLKQEYINPSGEKFDNPCIIIANHQSFLDILVILSLSPKIIMLTKEWVWNSPLFGFIIRYLDFYHVRDGYEPAVDHLREKINEGYSIAVFPEGTRTDNGTMKRFHKGAFFLAQTLKVDIVPVLLYGNYRILSKSQPFNLHKGMVVNKILPRISNEDISWGITYQERTKQVSAYMKDEYIKLCIEKDRPENPYFADALIQNYIYKKPAEEWEVRLTMKAEKGYRLLNELIPPEGKITDVGCGIGARCYMLAMLSDKRKVTGIDCDEDKIEVAKHAWLHNVQNVQADFVHADVLHATLPVSDVFLVSNMWEGMNAENRTSLLKKCAMSLQPDGIIVVQEDFIQKKKHRLFYLTKIVGKQLFGFNKKSTTRCAADNQLQKIAAACKLNLETITDNNTLKTTFLFRQNV